MIAIVPAILLPALLGYGVIALLLRNDEASGLLERLSLGFPLGASLLTFQMFFLGLLRVPYSVSTLSLLIIAETAVLAVGMRQAGISLLPRPTFGLVKEIGSSKTGALARAAMAILVLWIVLKLGSVIAETLLRPIYAWDAWVNWSATAKLFLGAKGLMLEVPAADFFGRGAVSRIISYPLHNPLMQVWTGLWTGSFDDVLAKAWTPVYLLSAAGLLYSFAWREVGRLTSLVLTVLFLSSPLLSYHAIEVYSDFPLGVHFLFALISLLFALRGRDGFWPLVGAYAAAALFTKNEAPGFVFPLLLSAGVAIWSRRREAPVLGRAARVLTPLFLVAPWFVFKAVYSLSLTQDAHALEPVAQPGVLAKVAAEFLSLQNFNILFPALPVLFALHGRPTREVLHVAFPIVFYACFFIILYILIPYYYDTLFKGTVFFRNTLTYYPSAFLLAVLLLAGALRKMAPTPVAPSRPGRAGKKAGRSGAA